jgi:hypothetical protein
MVDQVSIINGAIGLIGGDALATIPANINDASVPKNARWALRLYPTVYEATLSLWPWTDAVRRRVAGKHGETPAFGYSAQYELAEDELKVCGVRACGLSWRREGRFILHSGGDTLSIMTINRVSPEHLNAVTAELISARLAHRMSVALSDSAAKQEVIKKHVMDALREALSTDSWEGSSEQLLTSGWWLAAHTSYRPEVDALGESRPGMGWLEQA